MLEGSAGSVERVLSRASDGEWRGRAQQKFVMTLAPVVVDIARLRQGLATQAATLSQYAREVELLAHEQDVVMRRLRDEREQLGENRRRLLGVSILDAGHTDTAFGAPGLDISGDDVRRQGLWGLIDEGDATIRALEKEWSLLVDRRRRADHACIAALRGEDARGPRPSDLGCPSDATPEALLLLLSRLAPSDLRLLLRGNPSLRDRLARADPSAIRAWWNGLGSSDGADPSAGQLALIAAFPRLLGSLDGIPPLARVAANALNAAARIRAISAELAHLDGGSGVAATRALLVKERAYLRKAVAEPPTVQLYLYDQATSRMIEMIGTPSAATNRVITYVPGTFTGPGSFYSGGVQQLSDYLVGATPVGSTVAFVWKDGSFPGEGHGVDPLSRGGGLLEANNFVIGDHKGRDLASFAEGLRTDPGMDGARHVGIGHSWGLTAVTSSEMHGASYSDVVSLSGAGMHPLWQKAPETVYTDFSYLDFLQVAQGTGAVHFGYNPRSAGAFEHGDYFASPAGRGVDQLFANHSLVATTSVANRAVLRDLESLVTERKR